MTRPIGKLDALPRVHLAGAPTALERLDNLSADTGSEVWVKRDDTHALAFGGNKTRQLEFYFGAARAGGADTVLITGAVQSNFCRLTAAFAAKLGWECHIQQEERVPGADATYRTSGNVLVERLLGAHLHSYPSGEDEAGADAQLETIAAELRAKGRRPYVIHLAPGHPPLGALGYSVAARETFEQAEEVGLVFDEIVVPSGSGATHSGFLFGLRALGVRTPVTGICVRRDAAAQRPRLERRMAELAELVDIENPVRPADIVIDERFLAPGYGKLNPPTEEAILTGARREALMLDPVYSGKCMAGCLAAARRAPDRRILFLHTGGTPGIFAYANALAPALEAQGA